LLLLHCCHELGSSWVTGIRCNCILVVGVAAASTVAVLPLTSVLLLSSLLLAGTSGAVSGAEDTEL